MIARSVGSKVFQYVRKRSVGHLDFQKIVTQRDLEPVSKRNTTSLTTKVKSIGVVVDNVSKLAAT